jgi:prefoldin subunit 5
VPFYFPAIVIIMLAGIGYAAVEKVTKAMGRRGASSSELAELKEHLEQTADALEETRASLANQATQLAELQERVDFAERSLTQARNRPALGAGPEKRA